MTHSAGKRFRDALAHSKPLQIVGTTNAYFALMAEKTGFQALYLSGAGWPTPPMVCRIWA